MWSKNTYEERRGKQLTKASIKFMTNKYYQCFKMESKHLGFCELFWTVSAAYENNEIFLQTIYMFMYKLYVSIILTEKAVQKHTYP